jgi:hypothetical protein
MKKIIFSVVLLCLVSAASFAHGGKNKPNRHETKKEAKACKKSICPDYPSCCNGGSCCKH